VYKDYGNMADIARARGDETGAAQWQAKYEAKVAELEKLRRGGSSPEDQLAGQLGKVVLALAQVAYQSRQANVPLPPDAAEALAQLGRLPPPLGSISPFLQAVASGGVVSSVPAGLPPQLEQILQSLLAALDN
jgi:hypothetical protein